jgi:hypothetical protein
MMDTMTVAFRNFSHAAQRTGKAMSAYGELVERQRRQRHGKRAMVLQRQRRHR